MKHRSLILVLWASAAVLAEAQTADTLQSQTLQEVTVSSRRQGTVRMGGPVNGVRISREELFRAACCNLGESFTTNPSVDVNYNDAATGAKQIKLLGLSGIYVQMLTENLPNFRVAAAPYALDYVPGPWMQSIQVSKGTASVRNGYESITGQIDIEYLKPDGNEGATMNVYANSLSRVEANADANVHLTEGLSSELMLHYQDDYAHHDQNGDGFLDQPNVRQWNLQNRWKWRTDGYLFHGGLSMLREEREGGQTTHAHHPASAPPLYKIGIETDRYEGYMKHAFMLDTDHGTNLALMGNATLHQTDARYGSKQLALDHRSAYAQLLFETSFTKEHSLSAGLSLNVERVKAQQEKNTEHVPGVYAQYTYNHNDKLVLMAGVRADHSNLHGTFVTPRLHLKLTPYDVVSLRLSAGKGYRTVHALAENHFLMASGRRLVIDQLKQEEAWNTGGSAAFYIPLWGKTLKLNAEYYHTHFSEQAVTDYDSDPTQIHITNLGGGRSYSNTLQADATCEVVDGLELTAAYRLNDVKTTYGGKLMTKPLTSRYKGLVAVSYKTPLGLWQVDCTLQLNGGGRLPGSMGNFHAFEQLQAQVTRWFRHFSIYVGGENLTGFKQKNPILGASDPWGKDFEPTLVWGPVHGAMGYAGIRINIGNRL